MAENLGNNFTFAYGFIFGSQKWEICGDALEAGHARQTVIIPRQETPPRPRLLVLTYSHQIEATLDSASASRLRAHMITLCPQLLR